jgi:transposase-like protein
MGRRKCRFDLQEKEAIVTEAYSVANNIHATAKKHVIQRKDIRCWKKRLQEARNKMAPNKYRKKLTGGNKTLSFMQGDQQPIRKTTTSSMNTLQICKSRVVRSTFVCYVPNISNSILNLLNCQTKQCSNKSINGCAERG